MSNPKVYVPEDAKINLTNEGMSPPTTLYERSRATIGDDIVKDIVKGQYGKKDEEDNKSTGL